MPRFSQHALQTHIQTSRWSDRSNQMPFCFTGNSSRHFEQVCAITLPSRSLLIALMYCRFLIG